MPIILSTVRRSFRLCSLQVTLHSALCMAAFTLFGLDARARPALADTSVAASFNTGGFCAPPALGAPCAMGGTFSIGNREPLPSLAAGNPFHLASGNKYQLDVDLPPNPSAPGIEVIRHYNGLSTQSSPLGSNWSLSYDQRLMRRSDGWQVRQGDGSVLRISAPMPHGDGYIWRWPNGHRLQFDADGHLVRLSTEKGTLVRIYRHASPHPYAGRIREVASARGHALHFHYADQHGHIVLVAIDSPAGRFRYGYSVPDPASGHSGPRLESVLRPDGMQRLYHYEPESQAGNAYALTGISLHAPGGQRQRLASWKYDLHGRVIEHQQHGRDLPDLQVDYLHGPSEHRSGVTRLRSADGRQQIARFRRVGSDYRLLGRDASDVEFDAAGRMMAIGGLQLQRGHGGELNGLSPHEPGWPGLALSVDRLLRRYTWHSRETGTTTMVSGQAGAGIDVGATGATAELQYANGDTVSIRADAQGRPIRIEETGGRPSRNTITRLQWHGRRIVRVQHPAETESRRYDDHGRVIARSIQRPARPDTGPADFRESFRYDAKGRLQQHHLPEGGTLHYVWRDGAGHADGLVSLHWQNRQGRMQPVFRSTNDPGYRYGNGLNMVTKAGPDSHADILQLSTDERLLWRQSRRRHPSGTVKDDRHDYPFFGHYDHLSFVYDGRSRMQGASHRRPHFQRRWWYAWHDTGHLAALDIDGESRRSAIDRDAAGLPKHIGPIELQYGAGRRPEAVIHADEGKIIAQYQHNAFGHRIVKRSDNRVLHYLYLDGRIVAEASVAGPESAPTVERRFLHAGHIPVGIIDYSADGTGELYAVHADLSGAPRLVTDSHQRLRWLASYTPTGLATKVSGDLELPLRLPGQYADEETGWHDNLHRTYLAESGHYLEPDPLGPVPGSDTYGYANQQPWRYADPHGLVLFAFDGTRYSADTQGNVWTLAQAYRDGRAHYHSGPGNRSFLDWDAIVAWRAGRILENQWQALLTTVEFHDPRQVLPIDVLGFSRGAALARHFGNRVTTHVRNGVFSVDDPMRGRISACVDLRFMGLFDSVAQFGVAGSHDHLYDFGVSELWSWVSHAVALHEHRWAFPLVSADAGAAGNVVEAPFVGAHADIGGGLAHYDPSAGAAGDDATSQHQRASDLADVALAWMHWQGLAATVSFDTLAESDIDAKLPILRDMRAPLWRTIQSGDRAVLAPSGAVRLAYQDEDGRLGRQARSQAERFIERPENWRMKSDEQVGIVDMAGYARWLEDTIGWSPP